MRLQIISILSLTLLGFAIRLYYLTSSHPFFDEYTTVLAARQILRQGWPVLPSGLFYEHGLLATYLIAPFTALFIDLPVAQWQPAHWGLMLSRWPSVLIGTATVPLIYAIGRRFNGDTFGQLQDQAPGRKHPFPALLAAGLFALSPEGMVWGGRARMYALATMLVLLTVYWAYRGAVYPAPARYRWLALASLLAALLSQFGVMMLIPPLIAGMLFTGWLSHTLNYPTANLSYISRFTFHLLRFTPTSPWFLRNTIFLEGFGLAAIIIVAIWVKRLGRPVGFAALGEAGGGDYAAELLKTISYQTAFYFTWDDTLRFLARQFGVPHHFWLTILTIGSIIIGLVFWLVSQRRQEKKNSPASPAVMATLVPKLSLGTRVAAFHPFLWLVFGLVILEMVTLLEPFRRNPRYIVMYLPLFYLIAAYAICDLRFTIYDL
jgi:hypothetical protein